MAHTNEPHYRDRRRCDERSDGERRSDANVRNIGILPSTGNGSAAVNSLSLEELFINGIGSVRQTGNHYDHGRSASSTQDLIRLDHPRPDVLRGRNEYVAVTRNSTSSHRHHPGVVRQSTGPFNVTADHMVIGPTEDGLLPAHRAHSMPLAASHSTSSPVMAPVFLNGGFSPHRRDHCACFIGRPLQPSNSNTGSRMDFDRVKITGASKSTAATLPALNGCHPSTSSALGKPPIPGRAVRVSSNSSSSKNGVMLPTSPVISSQPRNSSANIFDQKSWNGKRANDCSPSNEVDCRRSNGVLESSDCSSSSLICKHCGRCRCTACTTPRTLPSRWICNNSCLLSADSVVDALSCVCCVKGCLYHAGANSDDYYDERYSSETLDACTKPCAASSKDDSGSRFWACTPFGSSNCLLRWGILTSAIACLPCIWCYFPMKACAFGVESAYSRYHDHGCPCDRRGVRTEKQPRASRSSTRAVNGTDRSLTRRLRRKRSHTLPPELPSIAAAKAAACNGNSCDGTSVTVCSASEYS